MSLHAAPAPAPGHDPSPARLILVGRSTMSCCDLIALLDLLSAPQINGIPSHTLCFP